MARRGSVKRYSVEQEDMVAKLYDGKRSPSSGAATTDAGDVRTAKELFECKMSGTPGKVPTRRPKLIQDFEKIALEAWAESRMPVVALRYYDHTSILANDDGWIDLTVRLASDDAERTNET